MQSKNYSIKRFFSKWFYISIILVLISIILNGINIPKECIKTIYFIHLLSSLLETTGLAIFISNIFTFILGSDEFLKIIRKRLANIVVSKDFITTLSKEEQIKLLHLTLKPPKDLSLLYSGINDYFNEYIDQSLKLFDTSYRGHLLLNATASFNKEKKCIQIIFDMDFVIYKINDKYENIKTFFEDENAKHICTTIKAQDLKIKELTDNDLIEIEEKDIKDPTIKRGYYLKIPEEFNSKNHISVNRKLVEYGNDHWQSFSYKSIQPYDGMIINLKCEDGLIIKNYNTYGKQDDFSIQKEKYNIKIQYHGWLTPGFGVNVIVGFENHHTCPKCNDFIT